MAKKKDTQAKAELERARNPDGTYIGDDLATADINEAWVETPVEQSIEQIDSSMQETAEAAESAQPAGVVTIEQEIHADEAVFVVVSHIKHAGQRYAPGDDVSGLTDEATARMLRSGSIKPKE